MNSIRYLWIERHYMCHYVDYFERRELCEFRVKTMNDTARCPSSVIFSSVGIA